MPLRSDWSLASRLRWWGRGHRWLDLRLTRWCRRLFVLRSNIAIRQPRRRQRRGRNSDRWWLLGFIGGRLDACRANDQLNRAPRLPLSLLNRLEGNFYRVLVSFRERPHPSSLCVRSRCVCHPFIRLPRNPCGFVIHLGGFAVTAELVDVAEIVQSECILWIYLVCVRKEFASAGRVVMV